MEPITYRIRTKDLCVVESVKDKEFVTSTKVFPKAASVAQLFKDHDNLKLITDPKNPEFLKGMIIDGQVRGSRITCLPCGTLLDKAYSLFAANLTVHDQSSTNHWDVLFQYPSGAFGYLYTLEKKNKALKKKYNHVKEFDRLLPILKKNLMKSLGSDPLVLPLVLLLETKMRVGSERYYQKNHHKGLTTLKKHDISIKNDEVIISFIAKDGVPQKMSMMLPKNIIQELKKVLAQKKSSDFIFVNHQGHPLRDTVFQKAFKKYCGQAFYPHIIRSHYATRTVQDFIKQNKKPTKEQVKALYNQIAEMLGHKKFSKKDHEWKVSYQVTLHHYIRPDLVRKLSKLVSLHP